MSTLFHRAYEIYSSKKLLNEVSEIKNILQQNGYLEKFIIFGINKKILNIQTIRPRRVSGISKITLDWKRFLKYKKRTKSTVNNLIGVNKNSFLFKKDVSFYSKGCFTFLPAKQCCI